MSDEVNEVGEIGERAALQARLLRFVRHGEGTFEALALDVARYQARVLPAYGRLVAASGPDALSHWTKVPPVPTELFAELDLCSIPPAPGRKDRVFMTSGTTQGEARRGRRRVPDLTLYNAAMAAPFIEAVLGGDTTRRRWVSLVPAASIMPSSSLSFMVDGLAGPLASEIVWCLDHEGLDVERARAALGDGDGPIIILTTAFALLELLDALNHPPRMPKMPPGSRLMLTGGFKGRTEVVSEGELMERVRRQLGIPADRIVTEYGMTELTSQAYGRPLTPMPTLRFRVVDPATAADVPAGTEGLVVCFDLLNLDNVAAILTSDLGVLDGAGRLALNGRLGGAMPRGCSLTAEELLRVVRPDGQA